MPKPDCTTVVVTVPRGRLAMKLMTVSSATYMYNGDGLRLSKTVSGTTQAFTWDEAEGLPSLLVDGTTNYVYGPSGLPLEQVSSGGKVTYYHHDQLGSTRALTNASGTTVGTASYDGYGKVSGTTGSTTPFGYAGQYGDAESGLQYLQARYYDPGTAHPQPRPAGTPDSRPLRLLGGQPP